MWLLYLNVTERQADDMQSHNRALYSIARQNIAFDKFHDSTLCVSSLQQFLADRTARSMIIYCIILSSVCPSVCPSVRLTVMLCTVAKRFIIQQKCLNKWVGSALTGTRRCNFQPHTPTLSSQTPHFLNHRRCWHLWITRKSRYR